MPAARAKPKVLLILAHPDDETIVGGFLGRCKEIRAPVFAVYLTRGEGGRDRFGRDDVPLGDIRIKELKAAASIYGFSDYRILEARDEPFRDEFGAPTRDLKTFMSSEMWNISALKQSITAFAHDISPDVVVTMSSSPRVHAHHQAAHRVAKELFLSRSLGSQATEILAFTEPYWYGPSAFEQRLGSMRFPTSVFSETLGCTYGDFANAGARAHRSQFASAVGPSPFDELLYPIVNHPANLTRSFPHLRRLNAWGAILDSVRERYHRAIAEEAGVESRYAEAPWLIRYESAAKSFEHLCTKIKGSDWRNGQQRVRTSECGGP